MNKWLPSFFILYSSCFISNRAVIVEIENGLIDGRISLTVEGQHQYHAFQGIPYAEPPVGVLRFEAPISKKNWDGILPTKEESSVCVQQITGPVGSEDCLYLSVFTPRLPHSNEELLPVMVSFYGGAFVTGANLISIYGPDYFLDQDVIVVMPNYRLGIFGFLTLGDLIVPGNNGLKDQVLALQWVQRNVAKFGGNPERVTVFGESAGSASVSYLLQSPLTKGLFQQAIMESGVSFCLWAFSREGPEMAKILASQLKINTSSSISLVQGLRQIDAYDLLKVTISETNKKVLSSNPRSGFIFAPVIEPEHNGAFLTMPSHQLMTTGQFHTVPIIVGYNSLELGLNLDNDLFRLFLLRYDFLSSWLVPIDMNLRNAAESTYIGRLIKLFYFGDVPISLSNVTLQKYLSDDQFVRPSQEFVRVASNHTIVYFYVFSYEGNLGGIVHRTEPGVLHTEELGYLWRRDEYANHADALTRARMIKLWTNFAKQGNPTPVEDNLLQNKIWMQANSDNENLVYLSIDNELELKKNPQEKEMNFWNSLYKNVGHPPYDTY